MITDKQILKASGKELERLTGEVLREQICHECSLNPNTCGHYPTCDCVEATWPNAMKYMRLAIEDVGLDAFKSALNEIFAPIQVQNNMGFHQCQSLEDFLLVRCEPEHPMKAAMLCKVRSKK